MRQIGEYVGSGPMRFVRNEWVPGAKAAFEKFADYAPREEPASWLPGGKRVARGPHRMDHDPRPGYGRRRIAERRDGG